MDYEIVHLDSFDGAEFERLCAHIFERLGWGDVEDVQYTGDEGRDLIIHLNQGGTIIVECKHQPQNSIGRPIVQKLHSAVVSSRSVRGVLVTSGKFTQQAIEHASKLNPPIELYDMPKLLDLADRAYIRIISGSKKAPVMSLICSEDSELRTKFFQTTANQFLSAPASPTELMIVESAYIEYNPRYHIRYDIQQNFETTVGRIHSINVKNHALSLDAITGHMLNDSITRFVRGSSLLETGKLPQFAFKVRRGEFKIDSVSLKKRAKKVIMEMYSQRISYVGNNNVRYTKDCIPGERSIFIKDVKQVLLPIRSIQMRVLRRQYTATLVENDSRLFFLQKNFDHCQICSSETLEVVLVCNDCGTLAHKPRIFRKHGVICRECHKTICQNCTFWNRRFLFFKKLLCERCADEKTAKGKTKRKLVI